MAKLCVRLFPTFPLRQEAETKLQGVLDATLEQNKLYNSVWTYVTNNKHSFISLVQVSEKHS